MTEQKTQNFFEYKEKEILRNKFLHPEELFLLGYLKDFNREKNKKFDDSQFWEFDIEMDES